MNKRTKILISLFGIIIVSLCLINLTYGYINYNIEGNKSETSLKAVTGKSELTFSILTEEKSSSLIEPGYIDTKVFTVKNTGNSNVTYNILLNNVINTFVRTSDVVYTLYKINSSSTIDINNLNNSDVVASGVYPIINSYLLFNEFIEPNEINAYALKVEYKNLDINQDENKGKTFGGKLEIQTEIVNPFKSNTLAYKILENALSTTNEEKNENFADFTFNPATTPSVDSSADDESELSMINDDYGNSYYFRGNVKNNYINFASMCWRIVRIEGDGSTKLILEDQDQLCSKNMNSDWNITPSVPFGYIPSGYNEEGKPEFTSSTKYGVFGVEYKLNEYTDILEQKIMDTYSKNLKDYLKIDEWCYDITDTNISDDAYDYGAKNRIFSIKNPTLKCDVEKVKKYADESDMYVGILTADEVAFAGGSINSGSLFYLINNNSNSNNSAWWTLSPYEYYNGDPEGRVIAVDYSGRIYDTYVSYNLSYRPVIVLNNNVIYESGNGTIDNPYIIN